MWEQIQSFLDPLEKFINQTLFSLGQIQISLKTILFFLCSFILLFWISQRIRNILHKNLSRTLNVATSATISTFVRFGIIIFGSIIILQSTGINLSSLGVLAGALGVGIGFGLQNITNNFISGIIILFEKPIKVGDRIEVGDVQGDVINIALRATEIRTNDNISIIVPNSEFISGQVINWSHNDRNIRFKVPVGVSYKENPQRVREILLNVAAKNPHVLSSPEPTVLFHAFGESSLDFYLTVWTTTHTDKPSVLKSELYFAIFHAFQEAGIEIPFPQRDVHIRSGLVAPR